MKNEELINRWMPGLGAKELLRVQKGLVAGGEIPTDFSPFGLWEGRIDLRGFIFFEAHVHKYMNLVLKNVDLSFATLSDTILENCSFENVLFDKANLEGMGDHANIFSNCSFVSTSCFASAIGFEGSKYNNCKFIKTDFRKSLFDRGEFNNCVFDNCNLKRINFSASSFEDCVFMGKLFDVWFRGGYGHVWKKEEREKLARKNRMKNVSFAKARLLGVCFSNDCDLSTIIMPETGNYRRYSSRKKRLLALKEDIKKWPEALQEEALRLTEIYLVHAENQDWMLVNVDEISAMWGKNLISRIINFLDNYKE